jgi:radical SAM protein with 4Fe4S-binding SPASM domain
VARPARRRLPLAPEARAHDQRTRPVHAVWEITLACDLACRHCGSRAGRARPEELTTQQCIDLVHQMRDLGIKEITLIGGEAYLREDWLVIIEAIRACRMTPTITTGGRGIDAMLAKAAAAAGLASASVSIDGLEVTHDRLRGVRGSFEQATQALAYLRQAGVPVSVNSQINRLSMPDLPDLLNHIGERQIHAWQLALTVPMGRAVDEPDVLLQPYDLLTLFPMLAELKMRADAKGIRFLPGNNVGYYGPYEHVLRGHFPQGRAGSCGAGRFGLGIEADGTIKGCPSLSTQAWAGGNVRDNPLKDIWERAAPLRYTRDRTVEDLWGYCRQCYYADVCRAGCTWTSDVFFGRPGNNPYCHHRAIEHEKIGLRERLTVVEPAPGEPFDHGRFELRLEKSLGATAPESPT